MQNIQRKVDGGYTTVSPLESRRLAAFRNLNEKEFCRVLNVL